MVLRLPLIPMTARPPQIAFEIRSRTLNRVPCNAVTRALALLCTGS